MTINVWLFLRSKAFYIFFSTIARNSKVGVIEVKVVVPVFRQNNGYIRKLTATNNVLVLKLWPSSFKAFVVKIWSLCVVVCTIRSSWSSAHEILLQVHFDKHFQLQNQVEALFCAFSEQFIVQSIKNKSCKILKI